MMSKVYINCDQLAGLYHTAMQNGTLDAFGDLAIEWAKKAEVEIKSLRAEVNRLNKANRVAGALNRALNAENSRLYADIENLKPDAERYRHLRYTNQNTRVICAVSPDRDRWLTGKALDDAIDDALRGEGEK